MERAMNTLVEIMAKRKGIVRKAIAAQDRGDMTLSQKLWDEARALLAEATRMQDESGNTLTTEDAYGLMGR